MTKRTKCFQGVGVAALILSGFLLCFGQTAKADAWTLAENGKSKSVVIISEGATVVERHAADELCHFLGKVTGAKVAQTNTPSENIYNIWLGTPETNPRVAEAGLLKKVKELSGQGFLIHADKNGLVITGKKPLGVLFGTYAFLEERVGMRWFFPGEDGEYCPDMPVLRIDSMDMTENPAFNERGLKLDITSVNAKMIDTWDWTARNRMQVSSPVLPMWREEHDKRGNTPTGGGHILSTMVPDSLFEEHPEYFGLYDGKRKKQEGHRGQPCTTHPDVINLAAKYMLAWFKENPDGKFRLLNNDWPKFCECEQCRALDPPGEIGRDGGNISTRWFTFMNAVCRRVWEVYPNAKIIAFPYQTFRLPPLGVVPDPRLHLEICDQRRGGCYRHSLGDLNCEANQWTRDMFEAWAKFKNPRGTYTYYGCMLSGGIVATPMEYTVASDLRYMRRIGHTIWTLSTMPSDGRYKTGPGRDPESGMNYWRANLHMHYIQAKLTWNPELDVDELIDDLSAKFYGPAGDAMGRFRKKLVKLWEETRGHFTRPSPLSLTGKSLVVPGAVDELNGLLDEAQKAAAGNEKYLKRVAKDRELFAKTWLAACEQYRQQQEREDILAAKRTAPIVIDGKLEEPDWRKCGRIMGFVKSKGNPAEVQTCVQLLYDNEYLYVGLEMEEPLADKIVMNAAKRDSDRIFSDDTVEVFIDPSGDEDRDAARYVHFAINPAGVFRDSQISTGMPEGGDTGFNSDAEIIARVGKNKWTVEMKVLVKSLGEEIREGGRWKMNVVRARRAGDKREVSSWADGSVHQPECFRNVVFSQVVITNGVIGGSERKIRSP